MIGLSSVAWKAGGSDVGQAVPAAAIQCDHVVNRLVGTAAVRAVVAPIGNLFRQLRTGEWDTRSGQASGARLLLLDAERCGILAAAFVGAVLIPAAVRSVPEAPTLAFLVFVGLIALTSAGVDRLAVARTGFRQHLTRALWVVLAPLRRTDARLLAHFINVRRAPGALIVADLSRIRFLVRRCGLRVTRLAPVITATRFRAIPRKRIQGERLLAARAVPHGISVSHTVPWGLVQQCMAGRKTGYNSWPPT